MRDRRIIHQEKDFRIVEILDIYYNIDDLKGDCFDPQVNFDISEDKLIEEELEFEGKISMEGVYGYQLEKWNPEIGAGWECIDSCFGFVGTYEDEKHYIVDELKQQIKG